MKLVIDLIARGGLEGGRGSFKTRDLETFPEGRLAEQRSFYLVQGLGRGLHVLNELADTTLRAWQWVLLEKGFNL